VNKLLTYAVTLDNDSSIHAIHGNTDGITDTAKSKTKVFVLQDYHSPIGIVAQTSKEDERQWNV
jgi:aminoglycoside/choline kinase family phosphotransferase